MFDLLMYCIEKWIDKHHIEPQLIVFDQCMSYYIEKEINESNKIVGTDNVSFDRENLNNINLTIFGIPIKFEQFDKMIPFELR